MPDVEAPAEQDQPTPAPEQPEKEAQPESQEESFTDSYNPDDLPEEAREAYTAAYKRLQADYTRKTQSVAEERQEAQQAQRIMQALGDPNQAPEVLRALGYDLEDEEPDEDDYVDPDERIGRIEQALAEQQQNAQYAALVEAEEASIADQIEALEEQEGRQFDDQEIALLAQAAQANSGPNGPDVRSAHDVYSQAVAKRNEAYLQSKRAPKVPAGGPGEAKVDLNDDNARREYMQRIMESEETE